MTRSEDELRHAAELLDLGDAFFELDRDFRIVRVNARQEQISTKLRSETVGRIFWDVWPEVAHEGLYWREYHRCMEERVPVQFEEYYAPLDLWTDVRAYPTRQGGIVVFFHDASPRKRIEEALRRSQEQLLQAQKLESVGRLAGGVAHDFNNLLTAILGYAELMQQEQAPGDPQREYLDEIVKAARRAASLTTQLLTIARRQVHEPRVLDLNRVIEDTVPLLHRMAGDNVEILTNLAEDLVPIRADAGQLHQILVNLTLNARDAMPAGGHLVLQTTNAMLATGPDGSTSGAFALLTVVDTGTGMTPEVQAHMFEPFFTTKEHGQGTGLGLATCHAIVTQLGGLIEVESAPGEGATFRIYIPRHTEPAGQEQDGPGAAQHPEGRGHETVLVVEDEPAVRRLAVLALRSFGYQVLEAASGQEALAVAEGHAGTIDLLVTDAVMPRMNGRELATRVTTCWPHARVLFMSGHAENVIAHAGLLEPGVAFLPKPFTPVQLATHVREVLDRKRHGVRADRSS